MDWITNTTQLVALITGLVGLISAGITAFISVKKVIKANKGKSLKEIWALIMKLADAAMIEAERSALNGAAKKDKVIAMVNAAAREAGIDISSFTEQLSEYIDQTINFVNTMSR